MTFDDLVGGTALHNDCRNALNEYDDLDILGVTFDSEKTFEKHLLLLPEQLLKVLVSCGSSGEYSMIDRVLGNAYGALSCPV